jgi:hypothetical protein
MGLTLPGLSWTVLSSVLYMATRRLLNAGTAGSTNAGQKPGLRPARDASLFGERSLYDKNCISHGGSTRCRTVASHTNSPRFASGAPAYTRQNHVKTSCRLEATCCWMVSAQTVLWLRATQSLGFIWHAVRVQGSSGRLRGGNKCVGACLWLFGENKSRIQNADQKPRQSQSDQKGFLHARCLETNK